MTHVTCRLTAKNQHQLQNLTLGNQVWATFLTPVQLFVERGKLCSFVTFSVNDNRYYFHQNHHSPRQWWYKWAQVNAYIAYFLQYISHLLTMIIEFLPRLNWEMLLKHVNSAAINTQFSRIVLIGTHVKPMSADTSVGVQSKMPTFSSKSFRVIRKLSTKSWTFC